MTLTTEAAAAYALVLEQAAAAAEAERKALRQAALDAVRAVLVRPDGTTMTMSEAGLSAVDVDLAAGLVVVGDGSTHLAARRQQDGDWVVNVVAKVDGGWTRVGERVRSLADIGARVAA